MEAVLIILDGASQTSHSESRRFVKHGSQNNSKSNYTLTKRSALPNQRRTSGLTARG